MSEFVIMLIAVALYAHFSTEEDETSEMIAIVAYAVFVIMLFRLTFSI